jgi:hypothetical protein
MKKKEEFAKRVQKHAEESLVKDGTVQFRLDGEMMYLLLELAKYKRTPHGVLARMWVVERLRNEVSQIANLKKTTNPFGSTNQATQNVFESNLSSRVQED